MSREPSTQGGADEAASELVKQFLQRPRRSDGGLNSQARRAREQDRLARERLDGEYHQARVLLLINALAGANGSLAGMTKLAKLDFLLRYPVFLEELAESGIENLALDGNSRPTTTERAAVESRMIRYKYGPWDDRYYAIVGALVGRGLVEYVSGGRSSVSLRPTAGGRAIATALASDPVWSSTVARCKVLHRAFARASGNHLKELIYDRLPDVVDRPYRTEI